MILLLKLLLVHVIVDFVLQSDASVKEKEEKKHKSGKLYIHVLLHFIGVILVAYDLSFLKYALVIGVSHLIIDLIKLHIQEKKTKILLFFIDQLLHVVVILLVWIWYTNVSLNLDCIATPQNLLFFACILLLTTPTSITIRTFISQWASTDDSEKDNKEATENNEQGEEKVQALEDAGFWIGILERVMIFGFIVVGKWEAIGFLLAAKSVFRFSDIATTKDRNRTEYILIGTLASFMAAIVIGALFVQFSIPIKSIESDYPCKLFEVITDSTDNQINKLETKEVTLPAQENTALPNPTELDGDTVVDDQDSGPHLLIKTPSNK